MNHAIYNLTLALSLGCNVGLITWMIGYKIDAVQNAYIPNDDFRNLTGGAVEATAIPVGVIAVLVIVGLQYLIGYLRQRALSGQR